MIHVSSPVIMQKGESQNGCFKKTKHAKFSEKQTFLTYPLIRTRTRPKVDQVSYDEKNQRY